MAKTPSHLFAPKKNLPEKSAEEKRLIALAEYLDTPENTALIYNNGESGSHINFDAFGHFNIDTDEDTLKFAIKNYSQKLGHLQLLYMKTALSLVGGFVALALAPLTMGISLYFSAAAFAFFGYSCGKIEQCQEDYKSTMEQMTSVYLWVMNDIHDDVNITKSSTPLPVFDDSYKAELNAKERQIAFAKDVDDSLHPTVKAMHNIFNPMLSDKDILLFTRNDIEKAITANKAIFNKENIDSKSTTKAQLSMNYCIFGKDQGSTVQIASGLFEICKKSVIDMLISTKDFAVSVVSNSSRNSEAPQPPAGSSLV